MVQHAGHRQMNAIGRRAVDVMKACRRLTQHQRAVERERIGRAAAVALGRHDGDIGERGERLRQCGQTGREVAIVVG